MRSPLVCPQVFLQSPIASGRLRQVLLWMVWWILGSASAHLFARADEAKLKRGELIYQQKCLMCHQVSGQGVSPLFPPLAGSDWLAENRARTIRVLCEGLGGPISVNGRSYNNVMPAQILDDAAVADVLTYVGQSWGNGLEEFTAAEVEAARKKSRYKTYGLLLAATEYQPLPEAPEGLVVSEVVRLPEMCVRMASRGPGHPVYVLGQSGGVFEIDFANQALVPVIRSDEYEIGSQGEFGSTGFAVDAKGVIWVVTNQRLGSDKDDSMWMNSIVIWRSTQVVGGRPAKLQPWFKTSYPQGGGPYNHGVSHMAFGPDGMLYINSGARTDGGEVGKPPKYHPGGEVDITACLWRMDPKAAEPKIEILARGIRNAYGFAWDDRSNLFTVSNGPDANEPEEIDHIVPGRHYGFPYQYGNKPAREGSPYKHTPKAPEGQAFTFPVANFGPAGGGSAGAPSYSLDPHSSPAGMTFCGGDYPEPLRGRFLIPRFGNLIDCPEDVGFDLLSARMEAQSDGTWSARVETVLSPLARPLDALATGSGRVLVLEYSRPINHKGKLGWLPGRILQIAPAGK